MSRKEMCALRDYKQEMPITHETTSTVVQQWNIVATINPYPANVEYRVSS